ncbi:MAG: class I SAM-dependent methyltransferase [Butyrivibrio sp.]|nr:class I SAM-dependent methyltransferase [Butyrivibrio sp.]
MITISMGAIYEGCRRLYYFLSPLARKQMKIERMLVSLSERVDATALEAENNSDTLISIGDEIRALADSNSDALTTIGDKVQVVADNNDKLSCDLDEVKTALNRNIAQSNKELEKLSNLDRVISNQESLLNLLKLAGEDSFACNDKASADDYLNMQRNQYNDDRVAPEDVVGQYEWHENYPYETFLLYRNGDIRKPIFETTKDKVALDFACGPGRMVKRMSQLFKQVDGCDISERMLDIAKDRVPECAFYLTNGDDLGDVPKNYYDFVYCTISMQHIASYDIRRSILNSIKEVLKDDGKFTLQLAYNKNFPYVNIKGKMIINDNEITVAGKQPMAPYFSNDYGAKYTNGAHDVGIGESDVEAIKADFSSLFDNVAIWYSNVSNYYNNLEGCKHDNYWATDWIYVYGEKDG